MPRITRGGRCDFKNYPYGRFSAQVKSNIPRMSTYWREDSIAVGVDINTTISNPIICKNSLLNINTPLLVPPIFFHMISIGSLAKFIIRI